MDTPCYDSRVVKLETGHTQNLYSVTGNLTPMACRSYVVEHLDRQLLIVIATHIMAPWHGAILAMVDTLELKTGRHPSVGYQPL